MPRLVGLLSWYQERPSWLAGCIASYAQAGITHLVAIDGAYALFPNAEPRSTSVEHDTIVETTTGAGIHLSLVIPTTPWYGNEIEKRTALFRHADAITQDGVDAVVVIDADEIVTRAYDGWLERFLNTGLHAADVLLWERELNDTQARAQITRSFSYDPRSTQPIRKVFRAIHGTHVTGHHATYQTPDGRRLWAGGNKAVVEGCDLTHDVVIEHRTQWRTKHRFEQSHEYYRLRNHAGIEA